MHPLLAQRRSLAAYLFVWAALSAVPWLILRSATPLGALLLAESCAVAFALLTLPSWYLCRALPLERVRGWRILTIHGAATAFWSLVFLVVAKALVEVFALVPSWVGLSSDVDRSEAPLIGVGALFYVLVAAFHYVLAEIEHKHAAVEREGALALHAQRAELQALRAQVHPHFLFNSLNTVSSLIGYAPGKAREACVLLGEYLRGTLRAQEQALVPLADEWALCERYLKVEALRLGERLRLEIDIEPAARACLVPSLLLQPLVENAITHGVALVDEPAPLRVCARTQAGRLAIELENGVDPAPRRRDGGVGLANVRARLAAHYGSDARLRVEHTSERFMLVLDLPAAAR